MTPDVTIRDYYDKFKYEYNHKVYQHTEKLNTSLLIKDDYIKQLAQDINVLKNLGIDLHKYKEWIDKVYTKEELLQKDCLKLLDSYLDVSQRMLIFKCIKYCKILETCHKHEKGIELGKNARELTFKDFKNILKTYYYKVHQCVLEGNGYKYSYGIGIFIANRWKVGVKSNTMLDFRATNINKEKAIAEGKKLYNKEEAEYYKARGLKYDGYDYKVYKTTTHMYEFKIIDSKIVHKFNRLFKRLEYVHTKLRGRSQEELAKEFKTKKEIYNLDCDIRYKLNILLINYPEVYLNFIRNAEEAKYKRGAHNSKDRQRFQSK